MSIEYKCFACGKVIKSEHIKRKIRCPYCGSRILFKPRRQIVRVLKAI